MRFDNRAIPIKAKIKKIIKTNTIKFNKGHIDFINAATTILILAVIDKSFVILTSKNTYSLNYLINKKIYSKVSKFIIYQ